MKKAPQLALLVALTLLTADRLQWQPEDMPKSPPLSTQLGRGVMPIDKYLVALAESAWPEDPNPALSILHCESRTGRDPDAWRTDAPDGGPYQINRASWERFFLEKYAWTWNQITHDPAINTAAARIIYDRTGDWSAWSCGIVGTIAGSRGS